MASLLCPHCLVGCGLVTDELGACSCLQLPTAIASDAGLLAGHYRADAREADRHASISDGKLLRTAAIDGRYLEVGAGEVIFLGDLAAMEAIDDMADVESTIAAAMQRTMLENRHSLRGLSKRTRLAAMPALHDFIEVEVFLSGATVATWRPAQVRLVSHEEGSFVAIVNGDVEWAERYDVFALDEWRPCPGECAQAALCVAFERAFLIHSGRAEPGDFDADDNESWENGSTNSGVDEVEEARWEDLDGVEAVACDFDPLFSDLGLHRSAYKGTDEKVNMCIEAMSAFEKAIFHSEDAQCPYDVECAREIYNFLGFDVPDGTRAFAASIERLVLPRRTFATVSQVKRNVFPPRQAALRKPPLPYVPSVMTPDRPIAGLGACSRVACACGCGPCPVGAGEQRGICR